MFSFERYYADDRSAYYGALRSVREKTMNMQWWLEYFLRGLVEEYERVAVTVADLDTLVTGGIASALRLTDAQQTRSPSCGCEDARSSPAANTRTRPG